MSDEHTHVDPAYRHCEGCGRPIDYSNADGRCRDCEDPDEPRGSEER